MLNAAKRGGGRRLAGSRFLWVALATCALTACGYHLARPGSNLPPDVRRIAIPVLKNETMEPGLEAELTDQLRRQFVASGFIDVTGSDNADALLIGTITKFKTSAVSFSTGDYAVEYRAQLVVAVKLLDRRGVTLWEDPNLVKVREYRSVPGIFDSEANKQEAVDWLTREIALDVVGRVFDGFE